jgi:hypothetical protein
MKHLKPYNEAMSSFESFLLDLKPILNIAKDEGLGTSIRLKQSWAIKSAPATGVITILNSLKDDGTYDTQDTKVTDDETYIHVCQDIEARVRNIINIETKWYDINLQRSADFTEASQSGEIPNGCRMMTIVIKEVDVNSLNESH